MGYNSNYANDPFSKQHLLASPTTVRVISHYYEVCKQSFL